MSISSITISQDNITGGSNLLPVHSPLVFIVDATYSGEVPTLLYVDITEGDEVRATYRAIPYSDPLATLRTFVFSADAVIRGLMDAFDDTTQLNDTIQHLPNITKTLKLKFYALDDEGVETASAEGVYSFVHGAGQFGEAPNFAEIFNNEADVYLTPEGGFGYVYFYNDDEGNVLTIGDANLKEVIALNDDLTELANADGTLLSIFVPL